MHKSAAEQGRYVVSPWTPSVGVAGWSIGGGHGPLTAYHGLGVDNILEITLVSSDGSLIIANSHNNSDLFWALRGGGGSTWGVITSITVKAFKLP